MPDWQWLMFIYLLRDFEGTLSADCVEGDLAWVAVDQVLALHIPQADAIFYPLVVERLPWPDQHEVRVRRRPQVAGLAD